MSYRLVIQPRAEKAMDKLPRQVRERLLEKIESLPSEPRPSEVRKVRGTENGWRVRVGDYRIVYEIREPQRVVRIIRIAHRKDVYRGL